VLWGVWFLDEVLTPRILMGAAVILIGTALSLGLVRWPGPRVQAG